MFRTTGALTSWKLQFIVYCPFFHEQKSEDVIFIVLLFFAAFFDTRDHTMDQISIKTPNPKCRPFSKIDQ
jgi:hypothetical protein